MALQCVGEEEEEEKIVVALENAQLEDDPQIITLDQPPVHPVAVMQGAFEESILESAEQDSSRTESKQDKADPVTRRKRLLDGDERDNRNTSRWNQKPSAKFHPLWKLVAQITFGMHLLHQQLAKSDEEVVKILHTHVNEIDSFLEKSHEDFDLAMKDIAERIRYLKLPLEHIDVFDVMLDDKKFRTSILDGNEKIEAIVKRTARAMNDSLLDVKSGITATTELRKYLESLGYDWAHNNEDLTSTYHVMQENVEGWIRAFGDLQMKGNSLEVTMVRLGSIVNDMSKRAGIASRRNKPQVTSEPASPRIGRINSPPPRSRYAPKSTIPNKPLPRDPDLVRPAVEATLSHSTYMPERRWEQPRDIPHPPIRRTTHGQQVPNQVQITDIKKKSELARRFNTHRPPQTPRVEMPADSVVEKASRKNSINALGRRLSVKRNQEQKESPTAIDSAYSSGSDNKKDYGSMKSPESILSSPTRPATPLALFPIASAPLTPSAASIRSSVTMPIHSNSVAPLSIIDRQRSSTTTPLRKKSSLGSVKDFFQRQRKQGKRNLNPLGKVDEG
ncbi:hypothetical protein EV356DRAFT_537492 [Viridothelium virens]|uniref:Uncharacterized protein n=1 Tax=Viridothelium virens TaxID=1048519 RepID=A0A6A6GUZ6_VIRVR|nr:hypothetical protein EV356DRAFT_537492 [Viridothelium virens]